MQYWRRKTSFFCSILVSSIIASSALFEGSANAAFTYSSGSGTSIDPYIITTCAQLASINDYVSSNNGGSGTYFQLGNNIDCGISPYNSGAGFPPIGSTSSPFKGILNGSGHSISNVMINLPSSSDVGLFGELDGATVEDLALINVNITGAGNVGGLAGDDENSTLINNVYVTGATSGGFNGNNEGGLVGFGSNDTIENSYSSATALGNDGVAELIGQDNGGTIENNFGTGNLGIGGTVFGFVGFANNATLTNNYTTSGILVGNNSGSTVNGGGNTQPLSNFYNTSPLFAVYTGTPAWDFTNTWQFANNSSLPTLRVESDSIALSNAVSGQPVKLTTPVGTNITCDTSESVSPSYPDEFYTYPLGLTNFCFTTTNQSNQVSLTYNTTLTPNQVTARKYNPTTHAYSTIPNATITETTNNSEPALNVTYTITDNGPLDDDPATGIIQDPVGLAVPTAANVTTAITAPSTGYGQPAKLSPLFDTSLLLITLGIALLLRTSYKSQKE